MAEPFLSQCQQQQQTSQTSSNCTGAMGRAERYTEPPGEDCRWQSRASPELDEILGKEEGGGNPAPASPPRATVACLDPGCPEGGEKGQNLDNLTAVGAAAAAPPLGEGQRPGAQPPQSCQGYGGDKFAVPVGEEEEAWRQQQQQRQLGKKKHRRRPSKKKRHWKPYYKLTWEEKKKFDEKQSQRASRVRAEMFAKGQPVAPYNTTQFLMDDHDQEEPDLKTGLYSKRAVAKSDDTSDEDFLEEAGEEDGGSDGMGGDGSEFLQRDFSETYERYHAESLQNMSKQELIKEYMELEKCLSRMEDENNRLRLESKKFGEDSRVRELELELDRLKAENLQLLKENELHRQQERVPLSKFGD
ncbi:protein HEXIM1 [Phascolarctos cinereus]|uniref:Protein HEXIM1 n=1 Tax=Phascolarctos cinereus TaxID=38626 RepID=A0A6P5L4V5_PHACI|nr:protein HEXIM1 [Phascolarctos cinereus]